MTTTVSMNSGGPGALVATAPAKKARDASAAGFDSVLAQQGLAAEPNRPTAPATPERGGDVADGKKSADGGAGNAMTYGKGGEAVAGPAALIRSLLTVKGTGNVAPEAGKPTPRTGPTATGAVEPAQVIPGTAKSTADVLTQPGSATYSGVAAARDGLLGTLAPKPAESAQAPSQETPSTEQATKPDPLRQAQDAKADTPQTPPSTPLDTQLPPTDAAAPLVAAGEPALHAMGPSRLTGTLADLASRTAPTIGGEPSELTNPGRQVTRQVGAHLLRQLGVLDGRGTLRLTLNPEHLGRVEITFERDGRDLNLTFRADAAGSAEALRSGAGELQTLLLGKGGEWDRVAVRVESDEKSDDSDDTTDSRQHREERDRSSEQEGTPS